jgi:hypothetical protein
MKEIINLSLGYAADNFDETISLLGEKYRVKRMGTDFDYDLLKQLTRDYIDCADIISFSGFPDPVEVNGVTYLHPQLKSLIAMLEGKLPAVCGDRLRKTVISLGIKEFIRNNPDKFQNKKISFFAGCIQKYIMDEVEEAGATPILADPYFILNLPFLLKGHKNLTRFLQLNLKIIQSMKMRKMSNRDFSSVIFTKNPLAKEFMDSEIFMINCTQLEYIKLPNMRGKTVILDYLSDRAVKMLHDAGVSEIWACSDKKLDVSQAGLTILESVLYAKKSNLNIISDDEIMQGIELLDIKPTYMKLNEAKSNKFAFIVHPLEKLDLVKHPLLKLFAKNQ